MKIQAGDILKLKESVKEYKEQLDSMKILHNEIKQQLNDKEKSHFDKLNHMYWNIQKAEKKFLDENKNEDSSAIGGRTHIPFGMMK